ncbi:MAG: hypothetical protein ACPGUV_02960 [Polyangiales bacterium]
MTRRGDHCVPLGLHQADDLLQLRLAHRKRARSQAQSSRQMQRI